MSPHESSNNYGSSRSQYVPQLAQATLFNGPMSGSMYSALYSPWGKTPLPLQEGEERNHSFEISQTNWLSNSPIRSVATPADPSPSFSMEFHQLQGAQYVNSLGLSLSSMQESPRLSPLLASASLASPVISDFHDEQEQVESEHDEDVQELPVPINFTGRRHTIALHQCRRPSFNRIEQKIESSTGLPLSLIKFATFLPLPLPLSPLLPPLSTFDFSHILEQSVSRSNFWTWSFEFGQFVTTTSSNDSEDIVINSDIDPNTSEWVKQLHCVPDCSFRFRGGAIKPIRLREHFATCSARRLHFVKLNETDNIATACDLIVQAFRLRKAKQEVATILNSTKPSRSSIQSKPAIKKVRATRPHK